MSSDTRPGTVAHCDTCEKDVKPVEKRGWANLLALLALLELGSVIAAIIDAFHPVHTGTGIERLILWPAAVNPAWLAVLAAIAAFLLATALAGAAGRRATADATCPVCRRPLKTAG